MPSKTSQPSDDRGKVQGQRIQESALMGGRPGGTPYDINDDWSECITKAALKNIAIAVTLSLIMGCDNYEAGYGAEMNEVDQGWVLSAPDGFIRVDANVTWARLIDKCIVGFRDVPRYDMEDASKTYGHFIYCPITKYFFDGMTRVELEEEIAIKAPGQDVVLPSDR